MRIVGIEKHVVVPELLSAWARVPGLPQTPKLSSGDSAIAKRRRDAGEGRLAAVRLSSEPVQRGIRNEVTPTSTDSAFSDTSTLKK
jgi:hypothetical protein